jgi:hypothetical protein
LCKFSISCGTFTGGSGCAVCGNAFNKGCCP